MLPISKEMHKNKQQSFQYGAIILLVSTVLVKIIGALFKIPLARYCLGDLGFGYFSSAYDLFTPLYSLAMAGFPIAVSRIVAEKAAKKQWLDVKAVFKESQRLYLITGLSGFILMLILIYPFVKITDTTGKTIYSLFSIAPSILFCCIMSSYRGYYEGLRNMYPTAVSEVIEALSKLILGLGFSYITVRITGNVAFGAAAAMLGITVGTVLSSLYLFLYNQLRGDAISKEDLLNSHAPTDNKAIAKTLILIAVPVVLASLSNNIASLVDVSTVKLQLSEMIKTKAEIIRNNYSYSISDYNAFSKSVLSDSELPTFLYGIRGKAYTLFNLIPTLTSVLGVSALPVLTSSWSAKDKKQTEMNLNSVFKMSAVLSFPAGAGFIAAGPEIMKLVYGTAASYEIGGTMLRIFGISALFAGLAIPLTCVLQAMDKQIAALRNIALGAAVKVAVNFIFVGIPEINIKGAAIGTLACYAFIFFTHFITLVRYTKITLDFKQVFLKPMIAALACGISACLILHLKNSSFWTVFAVLVAAALYFIILMLLKTFDENDILSLPKGKNFLEICKKLRIIR